MSAREHWSSRIGFILAAAGSAIGLGTMWMLPYVIGQNGGGAFILLFLLFTLLIGIPLFVTELLLGRQAQRGVVGAFAKFSHNQSSWRILGWLGVVCTYLVAGWYAVVSGWGLNYMLLSLADSFKGRTPSEITGIFETFRASGDLNVLWQAVFVLTTASIVMKGLSKGIEYWTRILTSTLFVLLVALAIYSSTLSGYQQAVHYILFPDFSQLTSAGVLKALSMALFALSLGEGIMVTYGSYMSPRDDVPKTSLIVGISIIFISILIALTIFPMVFTFGYAPESGEGLVFKTLPYVFNQLPGSTIIAFVFFTLLSFAALTSTVAQLEVLVANHIDLHGWSRKKAVWVSSVGIFLVGLPTALSDSTYTIFETWPQIFQKSFLHTNYILIDWMLAIFAFFTAIFVGWVIPKQVRESGFLTGTSLGGLYKPWLFLVRFVVPTAILLVILHHAELFDAAVLTRLFG